jgi:hypothetical protein
VAAGEVGHRGFVIVGLPAQKSFPTNRGDTTMAEGLRMTAAQRAVETMVGSDHVDVIRESVAAMVVELMEAEVAAQVGAEHGERAPDFRSAQRNGYRTRGWRTRAGEIDLAIPKLRSGRRISRASLSPASGLSRRWSPSFKRRMSTAS